MGVTLIAAGLLVFSPQTALSPGCLPTLREHIQSPNTALENADTEKAMVQLQQTEEAIAITYEEKL